MKKEYKYILFSWIIALIISFLLVGCNMENKHLSSSEAYDKAYVGCLQIDGELSNVSIVKDHQYYLCIKTKKTLYDYSNKTLELKITEVK